MRSRRQNIITALIVLVLGGVLPRAVAGGLQICASRANGLPGKTFDANPDQSPDMRAQQEQMEAADRIMKLASERAMSALGGTRIDDDGKTVRLYWKGLVPEELESLLANVRADGIAVEVIRARYSASELVAEARRIASLRPAEVDGVQVTGAGAREDYSGLDVTISRDEDLAKARQRIGSNIPLSFSVFCGAAEVAQ